jgi:hypothetical protein
MFVGSSPPRRNDEFKPTQVQPPFNSFVDFL